MSAPVPVGLPAQIRAGESVSFTISLEGYSAADDYTVTWSFRGLRGAFDFTSAAAADGVDHLVTVPWATTAVWLPGDYSGVALVTDGTIKKQVWVGALTVLPDLAAAEAGEDFRSQARRTLDNINAVLEKRANSTILDSTIEGTSLKRIPMDQLLLLRDRYVAIVAAETNTEAGRPSRLNVFSRFTTPR